MVVPSVRAWEFSMLVEIGSTYGDIVNLLNNSDLFIVQHNEDLEFFSWYIYNDIDSEAIVNSVNERLSVVAKYNKIPIDVVFEYINENNKFSEVTKRIYVEHGTTYRELLETLRQYEVSHTQSVELSEWELCYVTEDGILLSSEFDVNAIVGTNKKLYLKAVYEKNYVHIHSKYISFQNKESEEYKIYFVDERVTYAELLLSDDLKRQHASAAQFLYWDCSVEENLDLECDSGMYIEAVYDKKYVHVGYSYISKSDSGYGDDFCMFISENATYEDVLKEMTQIELPHNEKMKFIGWEMYVGGELLAEDMLDSACDVEKYINFYASYKNERIIYPNVEFMCINNYWAMWHGPIYVPNNPTYAEILAEMWQVESRLEHTENMTFAGWNIYVDGQLLEVDMLNGIYDEEKEIKLEAVYKRISGDFYCEILDDGTIGITGYLGNEKEVTIPSEIWGAEVTSIEDFAFKNCDFITKINIPESIDDISDTAFYGCHELQNINVLEDNLHYKSVAGVLFDKAGGTLIKYPMGRKDVQYIIKVNVKSIESLAFVDCDTLKSVVIPKSVENIGQWALGYYYDAEEEAYKRYDDFNIEGHENTCAEEYATNNEFLFSNNSINGIGDVNNDEKIDTQDAVIIKKYLAGYSDLGINEEACDVNNDGEINSADAVILLKHLAGYDVGLTE